MATPALPAGYQLDQAGGVPPLPAGYQLDSGSTSKPSALSRFGHDFLAGLGIGSNEDAKNFFEHPIKTAMDSLNAQGELAKKAKAAYDQGDYKSAIIHGLNYLVPFIGQQTDKAGEQIAQGDYAGAAGRTLGAAVPIIAGSPEAQGAAADATSAAASAVKPIVAKTARVASDIVDPEITGIVSPRLAHTQRALGRLADVLDKPKTAAAAATPEAELDATGENKPFAGGMDEAPEAKPAAAAQSAPAAAAPPAAAPKTTASVLEQQLNDALGGKKLVPGVPLKNQPAAQGVKLPQGFTPVDSSVLKGYKYDPQAQEFTAITNNGQTYTHGEVTPDQVAAFEEADSKGRAWTQAIRNNNPLVRKNGVPVKPVAQAGSTPQASTTPRTVEVDPQTGKPEFSDVLAKKKAAPASDDDDLLDLLERSLAMAKK